jgi:hypothetical protein
MKKSIIAIVSIVILATIVITTIYLYSNSQSSQVPNASDNNKGG